MKKTITLILVCCLFTLSIASCEYEIYVPDEITNNVTHTFSSTAGTSAVTLPSIAGTTYTTYTTHTASTSSASYTFATSSTPGTTTKLPVLTTITVPPSIAVDNIRPGFENLGFDSYTFTFASPLDNADGWGDYEVYAEENGKGILDAAISERNSSLLGYYDCFVEVEDITLGNLENDFATGSNHVDIVLSQYNMAGKSSDKYHNFHELGLDLEKPWWDMNFIKDATVNGQLYTMLGAFSLTSFDATWVMFFNNNIKETNDNLRDINLYDLVYNNEWTLDKFFELVKYACHDDDGDMTMTLGTSDVFGFVSPEEGIRALYFGGGQGYITPTTYANGYTVFEHGFTEAAEEATDKIVKIYEIESTALTTSVSCEKQFSNNGALFCADVFRNASYYGGREQGEPGYIALGILPFPKLSSEQENYRHFFDNRAIYMCIPITCADVERMTDFLEVYAYHSYFTVYNSYFNLYKYKYATDTESSVMIGEIFNSRSFDLEYHYNFTTTDADYIAGVMAHKNVITQLESSLGQEIVAAANEYREKLSE